MTKAKAADGKATAAEATFTAGAEAVKAGFDKAIENYDAALGFGKDTLEACMKSAAMAGKGMGTINTELASYSKGAIEDSIAAAKAFLAAGSMHEAFAIQTDFAKSAFESYVGELNKFSELFAGTARESFAPLQGRVQAWAQTVQAAQAR